MQKKLPFLFFLGCALTVSTMAQTYKRIVSLAPSLTQSIYFLEAQDKLVGCTSYCTAAKEEGKTIVASAVKANLEKIVGLKPDLVLASGFTNPEEVATLRKFGIRVEVFSSPKSFDEICSQFTQLGVLMGKKDKADRIVDDSKRKVEAIAARRKGAPPMRVFFQIGADPLFAVVPDTFMDDYIAFLGAENIARRLKRGTVGREFVIAHNPDCIFIATMGVVGEEEKKEWSKYANLNAARKKQIHIVDSEIACQPTPVTFARTMQILDERMQP